MGYSQQLTTLQAIQVPAGTYMLGFGYDKQFLMTGIEVKAGQTKDIRLGAISLQGPLPKGVVTIGVDHQQSGTKMGFLGVLSKAIGVPAGTYVLQLGFDSAELTAVTVKAGETTRVQVE